MANNVEININLPQLMVDAAKEIKYFPVTMGFQCAAIRLREIKEIAVKNNQTEIIHKLDLLGI